MADETPKGFTCKCGAYHAFGVYVIAHWDLQLIHTCSKCKRSHHVRQGKATPIAKRDEVHNTSS